MKSTRELDNLPSHNDWKTTHNATGSKTLLDVTPSEGSIATKNTRKLDSMPSHLDWQTTHGIKHGKAALDMTPSEGSIAMKSTRELDNLDAGRDWKNRNIQRKTLLDVTPSEGSIATRNAREFDVMPEHLDWQWKAARADMNEMRVETYPSDGSMSMKSTRDVESMPGAFDSVSCGEILKPLGYDTEPSLGRVEDHHARDIALNWEPQWNPTSNENGKVITPMTPDCTPTAFTQNLRELARMPPEFDWKSSKKVNVLDTAARANVEHEQYVDPCKRLKQFYDRGAPISGRSFKHSDMTRSITPPIQSPPRATKTTPPRAAKTTTALTTRTQPAMTRVSASRPKSGGHSRVTHRTRSEPIKSNRRGLSANMIAFLDGEEKRQRRVGKKGQAAIPSPRPKQPNTGSPAHSATPTASTAHHTPRSNIRNRQAAPGSRIPCPSPNSSSVFLSQTTDSIKENRFGATASPTKLPGPTNRASPSQSSRLKTLNQTWATPPPPTKGRSPSSSVL